MTPKKCCAVPGCPRKDLEHGRQLCPGHHILWERSPYRFDSRLDAVSIWIASLSNPTHTNGVT